MDFVTFIILWFLCGLFAVAIVAFMDYKENDYKDEYDVTIQKICVSLVIILFGIISLIIIIIGYLCSNSETTIFKIKIKRKEKE